MSSIEKTTEVRSRRRRKPFLKSWLLNEINLINLVSKHPVIYTPVPSSTYRHSKLNKIGWDHAWEEISTKLDESRSICVQKWRTIKHKYAMIMSLIISEKITKTYAMAHPESAKFFDGRLNFLDPYLSEICHEKNIPVAIHRIINNMFGLKTEDTHNYNVQQNVITHAQVKTLLSKRKSQEKEDSDFILSKFFRTAIKSAIKYKLDELLQIKNTLSHPNISILNSDGESNDDHTIIPSRNMHISQPNFTYIPNKDNENRPEGINLGLQSEFIIEDNIKMESIDENVMMEDEDDNVIKYNVIVQDNTVKKNVKGTILNTKLEKLIDKNDDDFNMIDEAHVRGENLAMDTNINNRIEEMVDLENAIPSTTIMSGDTSEELNDVSDEHIRLFFTELGVITSQELNEPKKKILKKRITGLLKRLLVGDLSILSDTQFLKKIAKN